MKLVNLAREAVRILEDAGEEGIRSDILASQLDTPKRRVYDVVAVLKALDHVTTVRKFDGTTVTWIDRSKDFVPKAVYDDLRLRFTEENDERKRLQVQVAELKEQLRIARTKLRRDVKTVEKAEKTEFDTTQLRIRALSGNGIRKVEHSGVEVLIQTHEAGIVVDPTEVDEDPHDKLLKALQQP
ncbi:MAG: hypothetical protein ACP6KW_03040 [Candidatus Thorarchaeota archaeon]